MIQAYATTWWQVIKYMLPMLVTWEKHLIKNILIYVLKLNMDDWMHGCGKNDYSHGRCNSKWQLH